MKRILSFFAVMMSLCASVLAQTATTTRADSSQVNRHLYVIGVMTADTVNGQIILTGTLNVNGLTTQDSLNVGTLNVTSSGKAKTLFVGEGQNSALVVFAVKDFAGTNVAWDDSTGKRYGYFVADSGSAQSVLGHVRILGTNLQYYDGTTYITLPVTVSGGAGGWQTFANNRVYLTTAGDSVFVNATAGDTTVIGGALFNVMSTAYVSGTLKVDGVLTANGSGLTTIPITAVTALQDSLDDKVNRGETSIGLITGLQDTLDNKQNRGENYSVGAATGSSFTPSGPSGRVGWVTRNGTAPQSGTVATSTATDTMKAGTFQGSGALLTALPISATTALQDSLTDKLNRGESIASIQDSLNVKLNRTEVIASVQDSLDVKANRSEAIALVQDSLDVKLNRSEAGTMAQVDSSDYHGGASINTLGKISSYNSTTTDGFGIVAIADTVVRTGQATDIGAVNFANVAAGLYEVAAYVSCTTASGSGSPTLDLTISWTDAVGATSRVVVNDFSVSATGRTYSTPNLIQLASGNITWQTAIANPDGSPQYSIYIVIKRIG